MISALFWMAVGSLITLYFARSDFRKAVNNYFDLNSEVKSKDSDPK